MTTFQNLETFICFEQLQIHHNHHFRRIFNRFRGATRALLDTIAYVVPEFAQMITVLVFLGPLYILFQTVEGIFNIIRKTMLYRLIKSMFRRDYRRFKPLVPTDDVKCCVVPLIHFNSYYTYEEDRIISQYKKAGFNDAKVGAKEPFCQESLFLSAATNIVYSNIFSTGDTVLEKMLDYKWEAFIRWRFILICFLHLVYYISYCVGISSSQVVFKYSRGSPITENGQIACVSLMFICNSILLFQEFRQLWKSYSKISYICSLYNLVDYAALALPTIMFVALLENKPYFVSVSKTWHHLS